MSKESAQSSGGIGFTGLLTIAFIVLKLCNVINWSWWWVLSPLWIGVALFVLGFVVYLAYQIGKEKAKPRPKKTTWRQRLDEIAEQQRIARELKEKQQAPKGWIRTEAGYMNPAANREKNEG